MLFFISILVLQNIPGLLSFRCLPGNLAVYTLKLQTFWDEESFPKQYPQWRPPAQWSKTVGFVHGEDPELFRVGNAVSGGVRTFIETGDSTLLDQEIGNRTSNLLDTILVPPITKGVGEAEATVFVDGNHTKVSVMTKIVPSPDWFIGLDSISMCRDGHFIDALSIKVDPLDGGTDNGFTFTSPNWPTEPQGVVFRISQKYPPHPAGSFNYPHLQQLPTIAQFFLTKRKDYELADQRKDNIQGFISNQKDPNMDKDKYEYSVDSQPSSKDTSSSSSSSSSSLEIIDFVPFEETNKINSKKAELRSNEILGSSSSSSSPGSSSGSISYKSSLGKHLKGFRGSGGYHASSAPQDFFKKKYKSEYLRKAEDVIFSKENKKSSIQALLDAYGGNKGSKSSLISTKRRRFRKRKHRKSREPKSCKVSEWAQWSACSKSCGIGESVRTRTIIKHPRHGGTPCPKLRDYKWCGSARNCNSGYFHW